MGGWIACVTPAPSETTDPSTDTAGCTPGSEGCVCNDDNTCDAGLVCASNYCFSEEDPSQGTTSDDSDPTTGTPTSDPGTSSSSATTTVDETTSGPSACDPGDGIANNDACQSGQYCNADGDCVDCSGLTESESCADVDPNTPVCHPELGNCVECIDGQTDACTGTSPVCDADTMTCGPCTGHGDCSSGACVLDTGACFPMDNVIWVDKLASCIDANGSFEKPFCEISDAVESVGSNDPHVIRVLPTAPYVSQVVVPSGRTLAIKPGGNDNAPYTLRVENTDTLQISPMAKVYIEGLLVIGLDDGPTSGIICSDASVWFDDSEITDKKGLAIISSSCDVHLARSVITSNSGGGIQALDGTLTLENSIVGGNGAGFAQVGGILLKGSVNIDAVYSTVAFNTAFAPDAIDCEDNAGGTIKNSIVIGSDDENSVTCDGLQITASAIDTVAFQDEGNNKYFNHQALNLGWFVSPDNGDFHLSGGGDEFAGVAVWEEGDPMTDIDADPRPAVDGASDFAGADVP